MITCDVIPIRTENDRHWWACRRCARISRNPTRSPPAFPCRYPGADPLSDEYLRSQLPPQSQPAAPAQTPCLHRGRLAKIVPGTYVSCGCHSLRLYECPVAGGWVCDPPPTAEAAAWLAAEIPEYSRVCTGCDNRDRATSPLGPSPWPIPGARQFPADILTFVRTVDLTQDTLALVPQITGPIAGVIGIARSGILPAAILATHLHATLLTWSPNRGLTDPGAGSRLASLARPAGPWLLVDDTTWSGTAMRRARQSLAGRELVTAAVYAHNPRHVDLYSVHAPGEFVPEWCLFNSRALMRGETSLPSFRGGVALDFDGVLCTEPPISDSHDLPRFLQWASTARPLHVPRACPIRLIASGRLESWRELTLSWLIAHGSSVDRLDLQAFSSPQERDSAGDVALRKAESYRLSPCTIFIESDPRQAPLIAAASRKTVICLPTGRVYPRP